MSGTPFLPAPGIVGRLAPWLQSGLLSGAALLALTAAFGVAARHVPPTLDERGEIETIELSTFDMATWSEAQEAAVEAPDQPQQASPHLEEVKAEKAAQDRPQEQSSPEKPADDLALAQEQTRETVEKAEPEQQSSERQEQAITAPPASEASVAAEPSATSAGRPDDKGSGAPDIGSARDGERRLLEWQKRLFSHIGRNKFYPPAARRRGEAGEVLVAFTLDAEGRIGSVSVLRSSGSKLLDDAAIETMKRSDPAPRPPADMARQRLELPMRFALR